ncbi:sulfotransferase 1A3-like [Glandiceps talaboti]
MADAEKKPPYKKTYYIRPGLLMPCIMNKQKILERLPKFEVRPDDVFLLTYPKAGTNWVCHILNAIIHADNIETVDLMPQCERIPMLELGPSDHPELAAEGITDVHDLAAAHDRARSPRFIPSHLLPEYVPPQLFSKQAKAIHVERNPKDCGVSLLGWHNSCRFLEPTDWDTIFEHYLEGNTVYGSYWEYMIKWYKYKNEPWMLWLRFEDMKKNPRESIAQIAKHIGKDLTDKQLDDIVSYTDFKPMKQRSKTEVGRNFYLRPEGEWQRRGVAGDWRNWFTLAQNERFDKVYAEKMKGYEEYMYKF